MRFLAFDTSTSCMSVGLCVGGRRWIHQSAGGAQASRQLIPVIQGLLAAGGVPMAALDAIVFGRGPGAFTGLRAACSVAQGLGFGAGVPLIPVNTLVAVAEQARLQGAGPQVLAVLDARMDQVYQAPFRFRSGAWEPVADTVVCDPPRVAVPAGTGWAMAGNAMAIHGAHFAPAVRQLPHCHVLPSALALLSLAPALLAAGAAVPPEEALPLYVRNKVARTVAERKAAVEARHG